MFKCLKAIVLVFYKLGDKHWYQFFANPGAGNQSQSADLD